MKNTRNKSCLWAGLTLLGTILITIIFFQELLVGLIEVVVEAIF
jgi:hypothetical protein